MAAKETNPWLVLITVMFGTFLIVVDKTIVNLAIPHIIEEFDITVSTAGWIATAYIIAAAIFVPIWGKIGDVAGRKKIYVRGFIFFIIGSVLAGLSWGIGSLIFFRIIQAIAGAADFPTAMGLITFAFKDSKKRAQALGIWSAAAAIGAVFGPLLGGPLIDAFGWRSVFLINIPIGIIGLIMALTFIKEPVTERVMHKFDIWGAATLGIAISSIVLVLEKGSEWGWSSEYAAITYFVFIMFASLFILIEQTHPEPIINLKFFKNKTFTLTLLNNFICFMGMMGGVFLVPVFAQTFLGYTSTEAGLIFIPMALTFMISAPVGGSFIGKIKSKYILFVSTLIAGIGIYLMSVFIDAKATYWDIVLPLVVMAFGMGLGMAQRTSLVTGSVDSKDVGTASSVFTLTRELGGAFGISISAAFLTHSLASNLVEVSQNSHLTVFSQTAYAQFVGLVIAKATVMAYSDVFFMSSLILMFGAFTAFIIHHARERTGEKVHMEP